jgi:glycosyltransferase involved in cell wall biosynthesis
VKTSRIMLVTSTLQDAPTGGREMLCKLNFDTLKALYGDRLILVELPRSQSRRFREIFSAFRGHIDGLEKGSVSAALALIASESIDKVFVDGSNLGEFVRATKARFPDIQVITFFHNVEARFFLGAFRQSRSVRSLAVLAANYLAERKAVRCSDKLVSLSNRDSQQLHALYGRAATHVVPMALQDQLEAHGGLSSRADPKPERYALFVGGVFYANQAGITWFVVHVVPRIDIKVCIVGRGFEGLRQTLERDGKVEVVGAVDSLADWYLNAEFVVAPIFDGSGMKTKVAEALMFGRKVIGTPEAFSGYQSIAGQVGVVCSGADEFVAAINAFERSVDTNEERELRAIYEAEYSQDAFRRKMALVLEEPLGSVTLGNDGSRASHCDVALSGRAK